MKGLASLNFFHKKQNLVLLGATGRGKTHLATALGRQLCHGGYSTQFMSLNLLFEEVQAHRAWEVPQLHQKAHQARRSDLG